MNFPRALIKAATFYITFCLGFLPAYYFSPAPPPRVVRPRHVRHEPLKPRVFNIAEDMQAEADLVIKDRARGRSYARLRLSLKGHRPAPEKFRARTHFFLPDDPTHRVWTSESVEILPVPLPKPL